VAGLRRERAGGAASWRGISGKGGGEGEGGGGADRGGGQDAAIGFAQSGRFREEGVWGLTQRTSSGLRSVW
jgi:hypothetical protein